MKKDGRSGATPGCRSSGPPIGEDRPRPEEARIQRSHCDATEITAGITVEFSVGNDPRPILGISAHRFVWNGRQDETRFGRLLWGVFDWEPVYEQSCRVSPNIRLPDGICRIDLGMVGCLDFLLAR